MKSKAFPRLLLLKKQVHQSPDIRDLAIGTTSFHAAVENPAKCQSSHSACAGLSIGNNIVSIHPLLCSGFPSDIQEAKRSNKTINFFGSSCGGVRGADNVLEEMVETVKEEDGCKGLFIKGVVTGVNNKHKLASDKAHFMRTRSSN
ncbi:hypothetical protein NE237_001632 [Protea cynaroides]|uniref:Uncharacterized protein n=1 Tax=Protea cynaroides TaxID=273540 RepID=A0A9Q0KTQ4_9MAGN|nr:hypothetical protein NE237_001632 [Protea cynaroides]